MKTSVKLSLPICRLGRSVIRYNPVKGLVKIATAETGERQCRRARDTAGLLKAIATKIQAQAEYIVWRDAAMAFARTFVRGPGRGKKGQKSTARTRVTLPEGDPGQDVADRWRKSFCAKNGAGTVIDRRKMKAPMEEAADRAVRICEQSNLEKWFRTPEAVINPRWAAQAKKVKGLSDGNTPLPADRRYLLIYADPPWERMADFKNRGAVKNHYPVMKLDDILALPVSDLAADNAVLFLWATAPLLPEAIKVVEAWGFEYKTQIVWIKDRIGLGWYVRNRHELLLIATKGDLPLPKPADRPTSVLVSRRRKHSQKPNEMYEVIERMYPELSKIELFARSHRRGWDVWGNQASEHPDGMLEFDGCDGLRMQDQPTRTNPNEEQEGEQRLDTRHSRPSRHSGTR